MGQGTLYTSNEPGYPAIGLVPYDGRAECWLDPAELYQVDERLVRLLFVPDGEGQVTSLDDRPQIPVGEGQLYWPIEDSAGGVAYGCVALEAADGTKVQFSDTEDCYGWLIAEILETRENGHIGDVAEMPEVGERVMLAQGILWTGLTEDGTPTIGLVPPGRPSEDGLDPEALYYRVAGQTVRLIFTPTDEAGE